ncbi:hemolysin family protein [Romboutsia sp.]|uniref:hemolysin family protein n=1 Tax=Romboutsia sp. TaxID=1965302 RepID=UPI003F2D3EC0
MSNLDSDPGALVPKLLLIVILTAINAFFASAEMAIVSVNKSKVKQLSKEGNSKAKLLEKLTEDPSNFLSTIQIGITLAGFFSSASAATGISTYISNMLQPLNIFYYKEISMIMVTLILSYFTLVFGELVPKRIALKKAEKIAFFSVKPVYVISKITKPFIKLLSFSTLLVLKITGNNDNDIEEKVSKEEVRSLILQSQEDGCIENNEKQMIDGVFSFNDKVAREIMTPRNNMFAVDIDDNIEDILESVLDSSYTRIPAYKDTIDNIIGILYLKDILTEAKKVGFESIDLQKILHEPYFILETQKTNEAFKNLKENKVHLALLFDEYGGVSGMITMEDLVEEIMGEIEDEYDKEESIISQVDENNFYIKGNLAVSDFNNIFNSNIEVGEYDTINGYLLTTLGKIPHEGISIELEDINLFVNKVNNRRIEEIKVSIKKCAKSL